jgi:hypothetical protein
MRAGDKKQIGPQLLHFDWRQLSASWRHLCACLSDRPDQQQEQ